MLSRGSRRLLSIPGEQRLCRSCRAVGGQASPRWFCCVCSGCFPWVCLVFRLLYFQGMQTDGWERGFWETGGSEVPRGLWPPPPRSFCGGREVWGGEVVHLLTPSRRSARSARPVLLMVVIASSQSAEREALGEPRARWPCAPGPPCSGILLAGFPALESSAAPQVWCWVCPGAVPPAVGMPRSGMPRSGMSL